MPRVGSTLPQSDQREMRMLSVEANSSAAPGVIKVIGEATIYHAAELYRSLRPLIESGVDWEVDVSEVSEIDTAGIQVLLACKGFSTDCNAGFHVVHHSRAVVEVLDVLNLAGRFGDPIVIEANR
jgi:anti-anti-sigma regulatory factor